MSPDLISRRHSLGVLLGAAATGAACLRAADPAARDADFHFRYILGSCMYGYTPVAEILPEVAKIGATAIDLWPKVHGSQREELDDYGEERFAALLAEHKVKLGCITQYKLGPFGLQDEMRLAKRLGCELIVTGAVGPKGLTGDDLKSAIGEFVENLQPHLAAAEEAGVTIAIENHGNNLIHSPEAIRRLLEQCPSPRLALALTPSHLPQEAELVAGLIREAGPRLAMFYAWQRGNGFLEKLPKEEEMLQLPGRGSLDFGPIVQALRSIDYQGWTEIFMHPTPRGTPIRETTAEVTAEINRSREYLEQRLNMAQVSRPARDSRCSTALCCR
jgi:sugar phosphate isomerase/epimerase